jgi:hypothetical protein
LTAPRLGEEHFAGAAIQRPPRSADLAIASARYGAEDLAR